MLSSLLETVAMFNLLQISKLTSNFIIFQKEKKKNTYSLLLFVYTIRCLSLFVICLLQCWQTLKVDIANKSQKNKKIKNYNWDDEMNVTEFKQKTTISKWRKGHDLFRYEILVTLKWLIWGNCAACHFAIVNIQ